MNATETTVRGYTTSGPIRGQCGHLHMTAAEAERCLRNDQYNCCRHHGYSDRRLAEVGTDGYLYYDVSQDDWIPAAGGRSNGAERFQRD